MGIMQSERMVTLLSLTSITYVLYAIKMDRTYSVCFMRKQKRTLSVCHTFRTYSAPIPHLVLNFKKCKLFKPYNKYVNSVFIFLERTLHTEIPYVIFYRAFIISTFISDQFSKLFEELSFLFFNKLDKCDLF